jgi:hypothetical protein
MADALICLGFGTPSTYRCYAQALIDGGELIAAREILRPLAERVAGDFPELAEVCGLLGRVHKQIYVETRGSRPGLSEAALVEAIGWYRRIYEQRPEQLWHGINVVALTRRAATDGIAIPTPPDTGRIAAALADTVDERWADDRASAFDLAIAAEAAVARGDWPEAERWLGRYLHAEDVDAFAVAGTLRQFTEIWGLSGDSPGAGLIPILGAATLQRPDGGLALRPSELQALASPKANAFERVLGDTGILTHRWLSEGLQRARAVAKIRQPDGRGVGTGFIVRGGDFHSSLGDEKVLLTNAHVVSDNPEHRAAVRSEDVEIRFDALADGEGPTASLRVRALLWTSPPEALDVSVLRLAGDTEAIVPCPVATSLPVCDERARVYVIGYPLGGELSFSMQDNRLIDHEGPPDGHPSQPGRCLLHYRAPTEPGSSGSPVFGVGAWKLVAIHHAGGDFMPRLNGKSGTYAANEGIGILGIAAGLTASLGA